MTRPPGNKNNREDLIFQVWSDPTGVLYDRSTFNDLRATQDALESATTWRELEDHYPGDLSELDLWVMNGGEYGYCVDGVLHFVDDEEEFLSNFGEEFVIRPADAFDAGLIPGYMDGDLPGWTSRTADDELPPAFIEKFGVPSSSMTSGSWWEFPSDRLTEMADMLSTYGYDLYANLSYDSNEEQRVLTTLETNGVVDLTRWRESKGSDEGGVVPQRLRIRLHNWQKVPATSENDYYAEILKDGGQHLYRAKGVTIPITELDARRVIGNPLLYYFSTALRLHLAIDRIRKQKSMKKVKELSTSDRQLFLDNYENDFVEVWCWKDLDSGAEASQEFASEEEAILAMQNDELVWDRLERDLYLEQFVESGNARWRWRDHFCKLEWSQSFDSEEAATDAMEADELEWYRG